MMKVLLCLLLFSSHILLSEEVQYYGQCRPPGHIAFIFDCSQDDITLVKDAFFGKITGDNLPSFCEHAFPNRTSECIPQRSENTRNIRLACNTVRGQCQPNGTAEVMPQDTFESCGTGTFTYAYAVFDCLPAYRSSGSEIDYIYLNSALIKKTVEEKVYLMSDKYDLKYYTVNDAFSQCTIKISEGSSLRFTVLDLYGLYAGNSTSQCHYNLSIISDAGDYKTWCGQPNWNYFEAYELNIPSTRSQQTVTVTFYSNNDAAQGRVWILVEVSRSDGSVATMEITSGSPSTTTSSTTTTSTTTPTTTTTTSTPSTTTSTTTTTTTTPSTTTPSTTTSTSTTTTTTTTPSTTTKLTPTTTTSPTSTSTTTVSTTTTPTSTSAASTITTLKITPNIKPSTTTPQASTSTPYASLNPLSSTTTFSSTTTTTPSTTISTSTTTSTTTPSSSASTANTMRLSSIHPVFSPGSTSESVTSISEPPSVSHNAGNDSEPAVTSRPTSDRASNKVVAIAVGVSVACIVLIFTSIAAIVCLCMYCSKKAKTRSPRPSPPSASGTVTRNHQTYVHSAYPTISKQHSSGSGDSGSGGSGSVGEGIYSEINEINESSFGVTIIHTGTMKSNDPSTVKHHFSVTYKVGGPGVIERELTTNGGANKDKGHYNMHRRIKGRPAELDKERWSDIQEADFPPPYSDGAINSGNYRQAKRGRSGKMYVPPGESGESDTDIQHNPLYGLGLQHSEDYNY